MNYYYKQVIILIHKHLTVEFRWDCNEGINRWVFIFCIIMNIPAVNRGPDAPMWFYAQGTMMSSSVMLVPNFYILLSFYIIYYNYTIIFCGLGY